MSQFIVQNALLIIIAVIAAVSLAMPLLRGVGFTKVYVLDSGLVGWMRDKLPLES